MKTRLRLLLATSLIAAAITSGTASGREVLRPTAAKPAVIPFRLEGANIVVEVELAPGRRLPFVFDSGLAHGNLITPAAAKAWGLKADAGLGVRDAAGIGSDAALTSVAAIRVGEARLEHPPFAIVPIPDAVTRRPGLPAIAGFLGAPLLADAVLCIAYSQQAMQRWPRGAFDASRMISVPMLLNHGLPTIRISIDGRGATMIVDSGNNGAVVVYPSFADTPAFRKRYPQLAAHEGYGGSGHSFEAQTGDADVVVIGPGVGFEHVPLTVIPQGMDPAWGIDGMVGYEVLSRLNPCLDVEGQRLLFVGE